MKTITTQLQEFGEFGVGLLKASLLDKGLNASMTLSNSLQAIVSESVIGLRMDIVTTEGAKYWQILNAAKRGAGKGSPLALFGIIYEWSFTKPISFADDKARKGFSAAVSRNIQSGKYMNFNRDSRKDFATSAITSPEFMAAETRTIGFIADELIDLKFTTIFNRPTEAT